MTTFSAKLVAAALIVGLMSAPALAERAVTQTVSLSFDEAALATAKGSTRVLQDLSRQAVDACTTERPILRTEITDEACVEDVLRQAILAIGNGDLTETYNLARGEQIAEPMIRTASAEPQSR